MTERKLVTIRRVDAIEPIEGADAIEVAVVGGWKVVVKKGEYTAGNLAVYFEIDSFLPEGNPSWQFLVDKSARIYNGVRGHVLRTIKLRGQVSQGLLLPIESAVEKFDGSKYDEGQELSEFFLPGTDVTELLGVSKWEAEIPACLAGEVKGLFPSFIPKTDEERIQNLTTDFEVWKGEELTWEETEKLDGSSMTVYLCDTDFGVCSRNLELKRNPDNSLWKVAIRDNLEEILRHNGGCYALQGELIGAGIQGNPYKLKDQQFYIYKIYDISAAKFLTPVERNEFVTGWKLKHVPVFSRTRKFTTEDVAAVLKMAEAKSVMGDINGPEREGLVFKCNEKEISFKAISNKFLAKAKE